MKKYSFAEVAIDIPAFDSFHYIIPDSLKEELALGKRVLVPFGDKQRIGFVVKLLDKTRIKKLKWILNVLDETPVIDSAMLSLAKWLSEYYFCSLAEAIKTALPVFLTRRSERFEYGRADRSHDSNTVSFQNSFTDLPKKLKSCIENEKNAVFLFHYTSNEKKQEIFLSVISSVLSKGKNSILLVPEIRRVMEYAELLGKKFGSKIAFMHSGLTEKEQFLNWRKIKEGKALICIGTRMAIFSPFKKLGLIIVEDEENEAYKQDRSPRYDAVTVALKRSELTTATVILASLTPRIETYFMARQGKYNLLRQDEKHISNDSAKLTIVDMKGQPFYRYGGFLSKALQEAIKKTLLGDNENKGIVLVNRRGFATYSRCMGCGFTLKCVNCNSPLVYHFDKKCLLCHLCNFSMQLPELCPKCGKYPMKFAGFGTEKVESEIVRLFPEIKTERFDRDVYLKDIKPDKIQEDVKLLIGTQTVLRFLRLRQIRLVAIILLDNLLNLPDFRVTEKTFSMLMHILLSESMRMPDARLVIQTFMSDLYLLKAIKKMNFSMFYRKELLLRKELNYPPFSYMAHILIKSKRKNTAEKTALSIRVVLSGWKFADKIEVVGPAPYYIKKIKGNYLWSLDLKANSNCFITDALKYVFGKIGFRSRRYISIDIDPR